MTPEEKEDLLLDAALAALPGVVSTFGSDCENRRDLICHKALVIGARFVEKYESRSWENRQNRRDYHEQDGNVAFLGHGQN